MVLIAVIKLMNENMESADILDFCYKSHYDKAFIHVSVRRTSNGIKYILQYQDVF